MDGIHASYNGKEVLKGISLDIEEGSFIGLIGPNGCGKTTLVRCITGALKPLKGKISIGGKNIRRWRESELARKMAVVPQDAAPAFDFTVSDVVSMGRYPHMKTFSMHDPGGRGAIENALGLTGLSELSHKRLSQLSGGERQRVYIARAFAQQTDILLMDEPNKNLDIKHSMELMNIVKDRNKSENVTVVCVLHDIDTAARFCDSAILMKEGRVKKIGPVREVLTERWLEETFEVRVNVHDSDNFHIEVIG